MIENISVGTDKSFLNTKVTKAINTMLECLLSKGESNCRKCKNCNNVDACCFLMESVFVYQHSMIKKDKQKIHKEI
jgi:hypothetical protein